MTRTDYVVVGAGPGGAVVANRLTAGSQARVVVLEAGPADIHPMVHIPSGFTKLRKYGWPYRTVEQTALGGVAKGYPQGRILGGATSTNAMIYVRGQREDYDEWAEQGNFGWSYDDVLPYFRRAESYPRADHYHGTSGPLRVGRLPSYHALSEAFVAAGQKSACRTTRTSTGPVSSASATTTLPSGTACVPAPPAPTCGRPDTAPPCGF